MTQSSLLEDCRNYFQQAQCSWDAYFSKWEAMAEEEIEGKDELFSDAEAATTMSQTRFSATCQLRKKSMAILNRKRPKANGERKSKWNSARVQGGKSRDRKRETEIIHTTENQTNLECEVVNDKHFEANLKAIFVEILSENTNKMGMFSVLSRTFSGTGKTISNFSLSSMIMEKNGFSISPVSKTVLHSASRNEFPLGGRSPVRGINDALVLSCMKVTQSHASNALNDMRMGHLLNVRECHITSENHDKDTNDITHQKLKYIQGSPDLPRSIPSQVNNLPEESKRFDCLSPEATLGKFLPASGTAGRKCLSEKTSKRKKITSILVSSDDDSEDDAKVSSGRFLKIFCTPKRPRRNVNNETRTVSDDCFRILDRVKTDNN